MTVQPIGRLQPSHVHQRRVHVDQADWLRAIAAGRNARAADDKRNVSGLFPDGTFAPVFLFTQVPAVIADQHDIGFAAARILI